MDRLLLHGRQWRGSRTRLVHVEQIQAENGNGEEGMDTYICIHR